MKQDWGNTVITNTCNGNKIKAFWFKVFPECCTDSWTFTVVNTGKSSVSYGFINNTFNFYTFADIKSIIPITLEQAEEIWAKEQQPELTFPREMLCWNETGEEKDAVVCTVLAIFPNRPSIFKVISTDTEWRHAKELPVIEQQTELTMQEIADKFNIKVEQLKIKK